MGTERRWERLLTRISCFFLPNSSPTSSYPLVRHLPNGQTVPLLPSPVQMTSVISVSHLKRWEKKCNERNCVYFYRIPFAPLILSGHLFVMWSLQGRWTLCLTSLGFQDLQWAEPAVVRPLLLRTVCTLRPRWWDNPSCWCLFFFFCRVLSL